MGASIVSVQGALKGRRFALGPTPIVFGRDPENEVVLPDESISRIHAAVVADADGYVVEDRGSRNGTWVNGERVESHRLKQGDRIVLGEHVFAFEIDTDLTVYGAPVSPWTKPGVLHVLVTGGGPVGLAFALCLEDLMGPRVDITVYDGRWRSEGHGLVWKSPEHGNVRRQQVVTIQSRQYRRLPEDVQKRLFIEGAYTEMWPSGGDSVDQFGPRNIRIARVEDELLALANEKTERIHLVPEVFDPAEAADDAARNHVLAVCEGSRSRTVEYFVDRFGAGDTSLYSVDGRYVSDLVLGLRVKSELSDPMAVLLTVAQNRFLLNSLRGDGFLNMRLTDVEASEACGIDPVRRTFTPCIQSEPCVLEERADHQFFCAGHKAVFLPALLKDSALWSRVQEGLVLFGVPAANLSAVTGFRLEMTQRARFTAQLYPRTSATPGTYGFLLGDAANAIHFWPGRGLNSGLASAISLARCLAAVWRDRPLRDADFIRHEAVMAMLQYRHKTRAWRQMVTTDDKGNFQAIKDRIAVGIAEGDTGAFDRAADLEEFMTRLVTIRDRLAPRLPGMPDDAALRAHLEPLSGSLLHTLVTSEPWDTANVGGEEVDVEWLLAEAAVAQ